MKLMAFMDRSWPDVVRSKAFFWLATRAHYVGEISQAGAMVRTGKRGIWWSAVPKHLWPDHPEWLELMKDYIHPVWGDRRQEIVFISCDPMDEATIRTELDACLVPKPDFAPAKWRNLADPFLSWER